MKAGIVLLAAGASRRFGSDKRAVLLAGGVTMLQRSVDNALASGLPLHVCLGPQERDHALAVSLGETVSVQCCESAEAGMGATLSEAVSGLPGWDVLLLALADMPLIRSESYAAVLAAASPQQIVVPSHGGQDGHPVAFGSDFFPALMQCSGDKGARWLLEERPERVARIDLDDPGIVRDVDTPEALASL